MVDSTAVTNNTAKKNMLYVLLFVSILLVIIYFWLTKNSDYWKKRNVPYPKPSVLFGNTGDVIRGKKALGQLLSEYYKEYDSFLYIGILNMRKPSILLRDPDLINDILIKNFDKFQNNTFADDEEIDPIFSQSPFVLKGEKWKQVRATISPQFTGGKVKLMFPLIQEVCKNMVQYLKNTNESMSKDGLEAKELASKFTIDSVSSCAFGLEGQCFTNAKSEFRELGNKLMKEMFTGITPFMHTCFPKICRFFNIPLLSKATGYRFRDLVVNTIKYRLENNIVRNDFLDIIQELKHKKLPFDYNDKYVISYALTFFLEGSETSAVAISYMLYELGANPDIQEKARIETHDCLSKHSGQLTYDAIQGMVYLERCFYETMRKYPVGLFASRVCNETCKIPPPEETGKGEALIVEKDMHLFIPLLGLHWDPKYYPNPDRFNPDRFTEENKASRPRGSFFGFGDGPRMCLGHKFATSQVKAAVAAIISNFDIRVTRKTQEPLEIDNTQFLHSAKGGIWLTFYKRTETN